MQKCILVLLLISLFLSCNKITEVEHLKLYDGVTEIVEVSDDKIAFLMNLKEYNNIIALGYISTKGEILQIYPIEKYQNVDVNGDYLKLIKYDKYLILIYENRGTEIVLETFNGLKPYAKHFYNRDKNCYGSIFQVGNSNESIFIKSSVIYNSYKHKSYKLNYFILDKEFKETDRGVIDLGEFHPDHMTLFNSDVYYVIDRKLYRKSIEDGVEQSVYNFDSDVIEIRVINSNLVVLLADTIFIIDESGEVIKGFNLIQNGSVYSAKSITNVINNSIVVNLKSEIDNVYKIFTIFGSQTDEYEVSNITTGDSFLSKDKYLIYSTKNSLYLKDL